MPVFECSRCNDLTYSSSRASALACSNCGADRRRVLDRATSFDEARRAARRPAPGDHACACFDEPEEIAEVAADMLAAGHDDGALLIGFVDQDVKQVINEALGDHPARDEVIWHPASDTYGSAFDPDAIVKRFVAMAKTERRPIYIVGCAHEPIESFTSADEWDRYERLATEKTVECGMAVLCLYDVRLHGDAVLAAGERAHPLHAHGSALQRNEAYAYQPA